MSKKCINCGTELKENAKFCPICGTAVSAGKEIKTVKPQITGKKIAALVVTGAALIGGGFVAYGKMSEKSLDEKKSVKSESSIKKNEIVKTTKKKQDENSKEKTRSYRYQWTVQPEIEADQIYYVVCSDDIYNMNHRQMMSEYAVIEKDGVKGFIDSYGVLRTKIEYQRITAESGGDLYHMKDQQGNQYTFMISEMDTITLDEENLEDEFNTVENDLVKETEGLTNNIDWTGYYYYNDEVKNAHSSSRYGSGETTSAFIPVQQSSERLNSLSEWEKLDSKYALVNSGNLVTDFIYDACGSCGSDDLIAVCKDGKWGYINRLGKEVIPLQFDTTWNRYISDELNAGNLDAEDGTEEFCYAFSQGYIPLRQGNQWELCDTKGNIIIPFGEFDEILPVNSRKRCWVKKDGKWGVIKITEDVVTTNVNEDWKQLYIDWVNEKSAEDPQRTFELFYVNEDKIPEIAAIGESMAAGTILGTFADDSVSEINIDRNAAAYIEKGNVLDNNGGSMDEYHDKIYTIYDGHWIPLAEGNYGIDPEVMTQYDENGDLIYKYEWQVEGYIEEEVAKEEYEQKRNELIDLNQTKSLSESGVSAEEMIQQIKNYK